MHTSTLHISPSRAFLETTPSSTNLNQLKDAKYNSGTPLFSGESNIPLYTRLHTRVYVKLRSWTVSLEAEHGTVSSWYRSISHGTHFTWPRSIYAEMPVETRFATLYRRSLNKPWNPASLSRCVAGSSATARMHLCTRRERYTWTAGYRVAALLVGIFISSRFNCSQPGCNITAAEKSFETYLAV